MSKPTLTLKFCLFFYSLCFLNSLQHTKLPSVQLYIILVRPERNVRQSMMPPRYNTNMHRTANTGPSSMMAAAVVTAATCAQEEKIQKHITPTNTEHSVQKKKLCEMATQTITITSIFTNLVDSTAYSQIPYADQYVPNNNQADVNDKITQQHQQETAITIARVSDNEVAKNVANNNKINQQQHHSTNHNSAATATTTTTGSLIASTNVMATTINGIVCATTTPLNVTTTCNHIIPTNASVAAAATHATSAAATITTNLSNTLHNESSSGCIKSNTVLTTSL